MFLIYFLPFNEHCFTVILAKFFFESFHSKAIVSITHQHFKKLFYNNIYSGTILLLLFICSGILVLGFTFWFIVYVFSITCFLAHYFYVFIVPCFIFAALCVSNNTKELLDQELIPYRCSSCCSCRW